LTLKLIACSFSEGNATQHACSLFAGFTINTFLSSGYVETLIRTVFGLGAVSHMNEDGVQLPLCSQYDRPDKDVAIQNMLSRFNT
jgi:hypothetical protein